MKYMSTLALALMAIHASAHAEDAGTKATAWPPKISFANGTELSLGGNLQYDANRFSGTGYNGAALEDDDAWRRQELGVTLKRKGVYDFGATFDFQAKTWSDVALRLETKALFGHDAGKLRIGQMKLPLGFEGNTAHAPQLRDGAVAAHAGVLPGPPQRHRLGVRAHALHRQCRLLLRVRPAGQQQGRHRRSALAWTPPSGRQRAAPRNPGSQERPDSEVNGLGVTVYPSARWRAKPEASLTGCAWWTRAR